tara:strand:+ start:8993 stop:9238 length:246 start_codon:yes stop_codon:yes gene_type:complete
MMTWDYYDIQKKDSEADFKLKEINRVLQNLGRKKISSELAIKQIKIIVEMDSKPKEDNLKNLMSDMGKTPFDLQPRKKQEK